MQTIIAKEKAEEYITLLGHLDNPYPILKKVDAFILMSKYEGTPVTIDEAVLLKTPVISYTVGGIKDQIEDRENGFLVKNADEVLGYLKDTAVIKNMKEKLSIIKVVNEKEKEEKLIEFYNNL